MLKILLLFPVIWAIIASTFYGMEIGKSHGYCNKTFDEKNGAFYPNNATNATSFFCKYIISNKTNGSVCVFFNSLFIDEGDEVDIFRNTDDAESENNSIIPEPIKAQNGSVGVVTGLSSVVVVIKGHNPSYIRDFEAYYTHECISPVPPTTEILHFPIVANTVQGSDQDVIYNFNEIQHKRVMQAFTFLEFNAGNSRVEIVSGSSPGVYTNSPPDFFLTGPVLTIKVTVKENSTGSFVLKINEVDKSCSGLIEIEDQPPPPLKSPKEALNNGSIVNECRWIVKHKDTKKTVGLKFDTLDFHSIFDIVAVNDGLSEISPPLLQVTTSNRNISQTEIFRSRQTAPSLWISFKPLHYASKFVASVTVHGQGGYLKNKGEFSMTPTKDNDTVFLLEVNDDEVVMLNFVESSFEPPATISIYDGFDTDNLLATLHGQIKFPVWSKSSRMMVVGTNFSAPKSSFTANFEGVSSSCNRTSTRFAENYILSENCNATCIWVIPPQDLPNSELIINLQYQSLKEGDALEIQQLDASLTQLGLITSKTGHVPPISVPVNYGALIKVTQGVCKINTDKIVLIGYSTILPGHNFNIAAKPSDKLVISSPLFPDTYPLYSTIQWNIIAPKNSTLFHLTFQSLKLAKNHTVQILEKEKYEFTGDTLPDDLFLKGNISVQFNSSKVDKKLGNLSLAADTGFQLIVTVPDCGEILNGAKGEFNITVSGNQSICIWQITVAKDYIITYSVIGNDKLQNYELTVYDGPSVRNVSVANHTNLDIWSRSNVLIVKYIRLNVSEKSAAFVFKYDSISCQHFLRCQNNLCMHPDWQCNGVNDCGDWSDEKECKGTSKNVILEGYTSLAFWLCVFAMLAIGVIAGLTAPVCYQRYRDSRYSRFRELSGIDG